LKFWINLDSKGIYGVTKNMQINCINVKNEARRAVVPVAVAPLRLAEGSFTFCCILTDYSINTYLKDTFGSKAAVKKIIDVQNLKKQFDGFTAVDSISFSVQKGEFFGLLGPNGAGKTTTIRMLYAFSPPSAGRLHV
jgi:ABC-type glutathione transport system ATPase component